MYIIVTVIDAPILAREIIFAFNYQSIFYKRMFAKYESPLLCSECSHSVMQIVARLSWPTARLGPAVSSPKTTVNITLIFSSLTSTELEPHPPVLFQHVCPFHFIQSLICMLHESLAQRRVTLQLYVLFCRKPTTRGFPQTGDIGGVNDPSPGSPLGKIPWDPRARSRGERNQQLSGETLNNSYFESSFVDLMETRIRQENLVWREKQKPQSAGKQEGGRCQRSKSQNPSCEKNFRRQRGEHWREERPHEEQCHNNYFQRKMKLCKLEIETELLVKLYCI